MHTINAIIITQQQRQQRQRLQLGLHNAYLHFQLRHCHAQ